MQACIPMRWYGDMKVWKYGVLVGALARGGEWRYRVIQVLWLCRRVYTRLSMEILRHRGVKSCIPRCGHVWKHVGVWACRYVGVWACRYVGVWASMGNRGVKACRCRCVCPHVGMKASMRGDV